MHELAVCNALLAEVAAPFGASYLVSTGDDGAIEVDLPDLRAAVEQVRATTDELAEASATESITDID